MATRKYYRKDIHTLSTTSKGKSQSKEKSLFKRKSAKKKQKKRPWKKIILRGILICVLIFVGVFAYFARQLPNPKDFQERVVKESTKIYDREGKIMLYEAGSNIKRTYVKLDDISIDLQKATIAAEDANFYSHPGVDIKGLARALIFRGEKGGGSTITQQFIKNALLSPERTMSRKIKEAILSLELERRYSKNQILEFYLNQVPYGSVYYGAESASRHYFQKPAKNLTLAESATLAALPQSPTYYLQDAEAREERKDWILDRMVKLGYARGVEARAAKKEKVKLAAIPEEMLAPYFVMDVRKELSEQYGKEYQLMGLKVYTSLDYDLQELAEKTVKEKSGKVARWYAAENMALVSINPNNGEILAMVGGRDFATSQVNIWTPTQSLSFQSPGSAFKPIVYASAFKKGYTPDTILWDVKTDFGNYSPDNYDAKQRGPIKMKEALAQSLNIPAVKTLYLAGLKNTAEVAKSMGMLDSFDEKIDSRNLDFSMAIGGKSIVPLELVSAFGTFATEGYRILPTHIVKIEDRNGKVIWENKTSKVKVLDKTVAQQINSILSDNNLRSPMFGWSSYLNLGKWAAVKTGTAATKNGKVTDVWTVGYTRNLVTGVWIGNNHNEPMYRGSDGSNVAAPVWNSFMKEATRNESKVAFPQYKKVRTGKSILDGYLPGKHCILWYLDKNNPRGKSINRSDPQLWRWEKPINGFSLQEDEEKEEKKTNTGTKKTKPTPKPPSPSPTPTLIPTPTPTPPTPTPTIPPEGEGKLKHGAILETQIRNLIKRTSTFLIYNRVFCVS